MFNVGEIVQGINGRLILGSKSIEFSSFSKDSRTIQTGDFYIPLIGENFDGHDYILDTIRKGAAGFFIAKDYPRKENVFKEASVFNKDIVIIEVENTLSALQDLARFNRMKNINTKLIAVTGSVGKTSTKEMISCVLEKGFKVLKTDGNLNNHIGVPLTLLKLNNQDVCVLEMGMNNMGEISFLSKIAKPDIAVITNIGAAHIGNLGSMENIFKAKCEIFDGLKDGGTIIVNGDDKYLSTLKYLSGTKLVKYGIENPDSNIKAADVTNESNSTNFLAEGKEYTLNCIGNHNVYNALCAMAIGRELGLPEESIQAGYLDYKNEKMRMQHIHLNNNILLINDAYNANYDSMKAGIKAVKGIKASRKLLVLGDMFEMGEFSKEYHKKIGELFDEKYPDLLITCGRASAEISYAAKKRMGNKIYHFEEKSSAAEAIKSFVKEGDLVYFKASRGMKFEEIVNEIIKHFGESKV